MNWYVLGAAAFVIWLVSQGKAPSIGGALYGLAKRDCPAPTQDLALNTKNRNAAIHAPHVRYGPINLGDTAYWQMVANEWQTTPAVAKQSRCGNCAAFDLSPRMKACMPGAVQKEGTLGYCWLHSFKCHSSRTCLTWIAGGPITTNEISSSWEAKESHH